MNTVQEKIKNAATRLASAMLAADPREWPPTCIFLTYQPMRPQADKKEEAQK